MKRKNSWWKGVLILAGLFIIMDGNALAIPVNEVDVRNYASFSAAIDDIGTLERSLLIPNQQGVTANKTVPSNVTLHFIKGGSLNISTGVTVTINGSIDAGVYQIFSGSGTVVFGIHAVEEIYPQWWGAKGDGATDDSAPFAAMIAALTSGMKVSLAGGSYVITSQQWVATPNVTLCGPGTIIANNPNIYTIWVTSDNVNITNIRLVGNSTSGTGMAIRYEAIVGGSVTDCTFANFYSYTVMKTGGYGFVVANNHFDTCGNQNIPTVMCQNGRDFTVANNTLYLSRGGIRMNTVYSGAVTGNNIMLDNSITYNFGIHVIWSCFNVSVTGNTVYGQGALNTSYGILFESDTDKPVSQCTCSGNTVAYVNWGIALDSSNLLVSTSGPTNCTVVGNTVYNTGTDAIVLIHRSDNNLVSGNSLYFNMNLGIAVSASSKNLITGNKSVVCGGTGIQLWTESGVGSNYNIIQGNYIIDDRTAPTQIRGIYVNDATCTSNVIQNNTAWGCLTDQITNNGTKTMLLGNRITKTDQLTGTFTMAVASTTTVANANVQASSKIKLIPTNAAAAQLIGSAKSPYINARTAGTSFTVRTANGQNAVGTETFEYVIE